MLIRESLVLAHLEGVPFACMEFRCMSRDRGIVCMQLGSGFSCWYLVNFIYIR